MDDSSTHSSPRSFPSDLYPPYYAQHHPHHAQTYPIPNYHRLHHKSTLPALPIALSVSTSTTASEHDPNEKTARPGNAHQHAQFLAGALTSSHSTDPNQPNNRSLLFAEDPSVSDDPGATPVVTHPPSTTSAAGLPTPLNSADPAPADPNSNGLTLGFSLTEPGLTRGLTRPLSTGEQEKLAHLDRLKFFLATAPSQWDNARPTQSFAPTSGTNAYPSAASGGAPSTVGSSTGWGMGLSNTGGGAGSGPGAEAYAQGMHPSLNRFMLPSQEFVTCVLWNGLYHITGTDIVRALVFRFEAFGRPVQNMKKFEEGVFSDLRNLKPGVDACLEEPKSPFLDLLFKYQCIRTQKKQKVFYWFSVPHDRLFLDALERDLKREKMGQPVTTHVVGEPALSFTYDSKRSLYEQFAKAQGVKDGESELESSLRRAEQDDDMSESDTESLTGIDNLHIDNGDSEMSDADDVHGSTLTEEEREKRKRMRQEQQRKRHLSKINGGPTTTAAFFSSIFGIFEGSPTYKQRRKKNSNSAALSRSVSVSSSSSASSAYRRGSDDYLDERGRPRSMGSFGSGLAERHHHQSTSVSRERSHPYPHPYSHIHRQHSQGSHSLSQNNPFQYGSMAEEFGPNSLDARERAELDAATLFQRQARGELIPADGVVRKPKVQHVLPDVGVMISEGFTAHPVSTSSGTPPGTGPSSSSQQQQQQPPPQGFVDDPSSYIDYSSQQDPNATSPSSTTAAPPYETISPDGKVRAFMCPLYSCGRLFRRMEHLKRHLRTHTMERPYSCPVCQKRFSRSDNLNQHLRTHERGGGATGAAGGAGVAGGYGNGMDVMGGGGGMNHPGFDGLVDMNAGATMGMWRDGSVGANDDSDLSGTESEGFDDDAYMYAQQQHQHHNSNAMMGATDPGMYVGMGMLGGGGGGFGGGGVGMGGVGPTDMQMCEIEVQAGDVSEIPGGTEEEGMLLRTHAHAHAAQYATVPANADFGGQWTQSSPAYNAPSPPGSGQQRESPGFQLATRPTAPHSASSTTSTASTSTSALSAMYSGGVNGSGEGYVTTSMSAPSQKQAFDHPGLYPPDLLDPSSSTTPASGGQPVSAAAALSGPIRRHRSMTPSLIGRTSGESIRRPMSTVSNASGGNGEGGGSAGSSPVPVPSQLSGMIGVGGMNMGGPSGTARGYHPYAGYGNTSGHSRSGSTQSSPAVYNVPLGSTAATSGEQQPGRSESRTGYGEHHHHHHHHQPEMFRTESPASFTQQQQQQQYGTTTTTESPAPYTMELPPQHMGPPSMYHASTMPHVGVGVENGTGYYQGSHATL